MVYLTSDRGGPGLYRHFDAAGNLLYVGVSATVARRTAAHRGRSHWFPVVARITIERFATVTEAYDAEFAAIKAERPMWNKEHNDHYGWNPKKVLPAPPGAMSSFPISLS